MLAVCSTAADTLLIHHVLFGNCRSLRLLLLQFSSCSTCSVRPAGHSTAKINKIRPFHLEKTNFAYSAHLSQRFLHANAYSSAHELPVSLYHFQLSHIHLEDPQLTLRKSQGTAFHHSAATHTFCHRSAGTKGSRNNNNFYSDLSTALAIYTPNIPSDPSFRQVFQIYLLSKSVPTPISVDYTSEQVDANIIKTSCSSSNNLHPALHFFYPFYFKKKHTALHKLQIFLSLSIHFYCSILFI
jgi:hypothetical protein